MKQANILSILTERNWGRQHSSSPSNCKSLHAVVNLGMPRPQKPIIANVPATVPDDLLDENAWDYLNKISTKKIISSFLKKEEEQALGEQGVKQKISFPEAIKILATNSGHPRSQTTRFPTKRWLDQFFAVLRNITTRILDAEETSLKIDVLEKELGDLLVEGQDLENGVVGKWKNRDQLYVLGIG